MTRRAGGTAESDANMQALLEAGAPVATIVGKSWDFHVTHALETTPAENLAMIARHHRLPRARGSRRSSSTPSISSTASGPTASTPCKR